MDALISVIVPIYNIEAYLPACLESILTQTYQKLEIILVDDGSMDSCGEICDCYAKKDSRIHVVHKANGGLVSARKAGLQAATGTLITYIDGDDWIEPDMYKRMYNILLTQQVDIVMCGHYEDVGNIHKAVYQGIEEGRYGKNELPEKIYPRLIVGEAFFEWCVSPSLCDKLFRRECLEKYQMAVDNRISTGEDAACTYPCILNADSIYVMRECLYHYRQIASSMSKKVIDYEKERERYQLFYQFVYETLKKDSCIYDLREQWKKYVLFLMIPRSDGLYRGYEKLDYLFPFSKVKKGAKIILYGAGTYGQRLYAYLKKTGFCDVVAWVDRNYEELAKVGLEVVSPIVIEELEYDAIVIANTYEKSRMGLYKELIKKYPEEKIHLIDTELIFSKETMVRFGLEDGM